MKRIPALIGLRREALLFDSKLYICKAILAIATGFMVGKALPITRLDMISVLLGIMYNLEPINIVGVKGGINQLVASTLGAACTGILIIVFGINVFTIAISMALTLYVSIKINWRAVSPVAIFTCIYMTQFVQSTTAGVPSIWLTFRLRIVALGVGVLIAILFNYMFSFFYYRRIANKRLQFAKIQLLNGLRYTERQLENYEENSGRDYLTLFPSIFNDLDLAYSNIDMMINESRYSFNLLQPDKLKTMQKILQCFRDINHLAYDINFIICRDVKYNKIDENALKSIRSFISTIKNIDFMSNKQYVDNVKNSLKEYTGEWDERMSSNINLIKGYIVEVIEEAKKL
jgi:hypothetical protein